jgi:hypothetical protein
MNKQALARKLLHKLAEKKAGIMLPLAAGAALVGGAHILGKGAKKSRENMAGFQPGGFGGHQ